MHSGCPARRHRDPFLPFMCRYCLQSLLTSLACPGLCMFQRILVYIITVYTHKILIRNFKDRYFESCPHSFQHDTITTVDAMQHQLLCRVLRQQSGSLPHPDHTICILPLYYLYIS